MSHLLLLMAGLGATHHHASPTHHKPRATWAECVSFSGCSWHGIMKAPRRPTGHWTRCNTESGLTVCVQYPTWKHAHRAVLAVKSATRTAPIIRATVRRVDGRIELWYVTWYAATGRPMASGQMPFVGAAACGYDVALGTRIIVAGLGTYTCLDREGFMPYHHADLFNVPDGAGYRQVTVLP